LGKQLYRLPSFGINVITEVGLDETSLTVLMLGLTKPAQPTVLWFIKICFSQNFILLGSCKIFGSYYPLPNGQAYVCKKPSYKYHSTQTCLIKNHAAANQQYGNQYSDQSNPHDSNFSFRTMTK
jgi:hypothetical protein